MPGHARAAAAAAFRSPAAATAPGGNSAPTRPGPGGTGCCCCCRRPIARSSGPPRAGPPSGSAGTWRARAIERGGLLPRRAPPLPRPAASPPPSSEPRRHCNRLPGATLALTIAQAHVSSLLDRRRKWCASRGPGVNLARSKRRLFSAPARWRRSARAPVSRPAAFFPSKTSGSGL